LRLSLVCPRLGEERINTENETGTSIGTEVNTHPTILVVGASGLVGQAAFGHFADRAEWNVIGVSRRPPSAINRGRWLPLDLTDPAACRETLSSVNVTHLIYAAVHESAGLTGGWFDDAVIARNQAMLRNVVDHLLARNELCHISLLQGTKAYGIHHPAIGWQGVDNPLRERAPRRQHPNFYFLQEDYLRERQSQGSWGLTIFRPTVVYGDALGNNMSVIPVLAAWGVLLREEERPLDYPGMRMSHMVREAVDADLVARALHWAALSEAAWGSTYNLTNGDVFTWPGVWPAIADCLGMTVGEHRPTRLVDALPALADRWASLVERHALRSPTGVLEFAGQNSMIYADLLLSGDDPPEGPILNSTVAIRQDGFTHCLDTEAMFRKWFRRLEEQRLIPPRPS
jgi:nucleoside-diphosphate-sugar epimerase